MSIHSFTASLQSGHCFFDDWIGDYVASHFPKSDETIDSRREADGEDAVVAGGARGFVVQIKRAVVVVTTQQHQHVEPVERIHQADRDIDIMFEPITIVNIEMPQFAG